MPFATEWKRSAPPAVVRCSATSKRRQDDDDLGAGQRLREVVDRAGQYGLAVEQHELFGQVAAHARAAAAGDYYYPYVRCYAFHISFFPNPSVLSVNLR